MQLDINGLQYFDNYITAAHEAELISHIDNSTWQNVFSRRVQQYGYPYDYISHEVNHQSFLPFPSWAKQLTQRLWNEKLMPYLCNQLIINEYPVGIGIAPHIDGVKCFDDTIVVLSIGSGCVMDFYRHNEKKHQFSYYICPCSLLLLTGEARYEWMHGIKSLHYDTYNNQNIPRQRRLSLSFRKSVNFF